MAGWHQIWTCRQNCPRADYMYFTVVLATAIPKYWYPTHSYQLPVIFELHYSDVIMGAIASQITNLAIVYSTVYSDANQRKHRSSVSLAFVRGIHRGSIDSPPKGPVTRKMFPFDDVIMMNDTHRNVVLFSVLSLVYILHFVLYLTIHLPHTTHCHFMRHWMKIDFYNRSDIFYISRRELMRSWDLDCFCNHKWFNALLSIHSVCSTNVHWKNKVGNVGFNQIEKNQGHVYVEKESTRVFGKKPLNAYTFSNISWSNCWIKYSFE